MYLNFASWILKQLLEMNNTRQESLKECRETYRLIGDIFMKYKVIKQKIDLRKNLNIEIPYEWIQFVKEIEITLSVIKSEELQILKMHFNPFKSRDDIFLSNSKYYALLKNACKKLIYLFDDLPTSLIEPNNNKKLEHASW